MTRITSKKEKRIGNRLQNNSQGYQIWRRFRRNGAAMTGLVIFVFLLLVVAFSGVLYSYDEVVIQQNFAERLQAPSWAHPFGTDDFGRDILARVAYGSRYSLGIGFASVAISLVLGVALGSTSGYFGKAADMVIMRFTDILMAIPNILLAIIIVSVAGTSPGALIVSLSLAGVPSFTRVARGAVLTVCDMEYSEAARAIGAPHPYIILKHIIPNCMAPLLVQATLQMATTILAVSGMSYLGMGIQTPIPEWGSMLSAARGYLAGYSYMAVFPGLAIVLAILSLNLIGDGFRDAADPRLK